jgi:hypothetical protein
MRHFNFRFLGLIFITLSGTSFAQQRELEIHYINVGQGGSTLIIGPNGTKILYDFGRVAGRKYIVPYLKEQLKLHPEKGIDYAIVSHGDKDHYMGYRDVVSEEIGGFNILNANYEPGTPKRSVTLENYLLAPSESSTSWGYYQLVRPEVGVISVGPDQGSFLQPRVDVVEKVLTCKTSDGNFQEKACSRPQEDTRRLSD